MATAAIRRANPSALRSKWFLLAIVAVCGPVLANGAWVITQRHGQPLDIDEAGYVAMALQDYLGLHFGGLSGWWHEIVNQPVQAPLAPAIASLFDFVTAPNSLIINALMVSVLSYGVILLVTLGLTADWPRVARVLAFFFVASSPGLIQSSRSFVFSETAAACLAAALYFAQRSRSFTRTGPALAWGVCVGLMPLTRTMTIAFVPGVVVAALAPAIARRSRSGLVRIGAGLLVAAGVAATWFVHNFTGVYRYLTGAGYGAAADQYGNTKVHWSIFSPTNWHSFLVNMTNTYIFVGGLLFLLVGWLACVVVVTRRGLRLGRSGWSSLLAGLEGWVATSPLALACAIVAVTGILALMSTPNQGNGFIVPLIVPLMMVAVRGAMIVLERAVHPPATLPRRGVLALRVTTLTVAVVSIGLAATAAAITFEPITREVRYRAQIPGGDRLAVWDSTAVLRGYEDAGATAEDPNPALPAVGRAWLAASHTVDSQIWQTARSTSRVPFAVFTFIAHMINTNTIEVDSLLQHQTAIPIAAMMPSRLHRGVPYYLAQVASARSAVSVVATLSPGPDQFIPTVPAAAGLAYVRLLHFVPFARDRLPDGAILTLWTAPG